MAIRLYMDVHVPRAITASLRLRGVDVLTAQDDHAEEFLDPVLLDRATDLQRVIFTHDSDFLAEAAARQQAGFPFGGVIYAHPLQVSIGACIRDLELIAKVADPDDLANNVEYLPL